MRMVPINCVYPKTVLKGCREFVETVLIRQLHEAGITRLMSWLVMKGFEYHRQYGVT